MVRIYGQHGATGVMSEWHQFVKNQMRLGGFSDAVFSVVAALLAEDPGRFVAEVEAVEL